MNCFFTHLAQKDLESIWCYIAEDNLEAADQWESDVYAACELLAQQPEMGEKRPKWTDKAVRFWPVRKNYLIVYRPATQPLEILRIFNAAQDIPQCL
jgi:plasmid stabilization system protein ParE